MARVLIVSSVDLSADVGRTAVWRNSVSRLQVKGPEGAIEASLRDELGLILLDAPPPIVAEWVRRLGEHPATSMIPLVVLDRGDVGAEGEARLRARGARMVLPVPAEPLLWDERLRELLQVRSRRQLRVPVRLETWSRFGPGGEVIEGRSLDLSARGMLLETPFPPELGAKLDLRFRLPGAAADVSVVGEVVRRAGRGELGFLSGLEFAVAEGDGRRRIADFVAKAARSGAGAPAASFDTRERSEWHTELRASEARKAAILDSALDAIVTVDAEGRILEFNPAAAQMFGCERGDAFGARADFLVPADLRDRARRELHRFLGVSRLERGGRRFESRALRRGGGQFPVDVAVSPTFVKGRLLATLYLRDVTDRKRTEEQIRDSERRYRRLSEEMGRTVATLRAAEAELMRSASRDALTDLPNRSAFLRALDRAVADCGARGARMALLFVDLDGFKAVNDRHGHLAGDVVLRSVAARLQRAVRTSDSLARIGGDEFTILLRDVSGAADAERIARNALEQLARPTEVAGGDVSVTASIGISLHPEDGRDGQTLLRHADLAMYRAKELGKSTHRFFTRGLGEQIEQRIQLEADLRSALADRQLRVHYQPLVSGAGAPFGVEALMRWQHPRHGLLAPEHFLSGALESGLIVPMGDWVLREACRFAGALGRPELRLAVNLSVRQCAHPGLVEMVEKTLRGAGVAPASLELEVTESALMRHAGDVVRRLGQLRELGVHLALDDFGSGYSSIGRLSGTGVERLKIDRSIVAGIPGDPSHRSVARAILAISDALELDVIAEGVETGAQLEALRELGCRQFQGRLFSPPLPGAEIGDWLSGR